MHTFEECRFASALYNRQSSGAISVNTEKAFLRFLSQGLQNLLLHIKKGQIPHSFSISENTFYFLAIVYYVPT